MKKEMGVYLLENKPRCLLVGNGINRLFKDESWEALIKNELEISKQSYSYDEIKDMPATMQIVVATSDNVGSRMADLSKKMMNINITSERTQFLRELLNLPVDDILTANYSLELEAADGMPLKKTSYSSHLKSSFSLTEKEKKLRVFQYYETSKNKRIWHIHGDVAKPETILMGHYYYAKQLKAIQDCVAKTVRRYHIRQKDGSPFQPYSWIDQFLTGDVYILGFGMYMCESDLWYLLCCKKRNFPEARTYFYDLEVTDLCKKKLLEAYNVEIIECKSLGAKDYDTDYYQIAINDMCQRIK